MENQCCRVEYFCPFPVNVRTAANLAKKRNMIILNLKCASEHSFEGWFASTEAFDDQTRARLVSCPLCADTAITRLPSGPHVKRVGEKPAGGGMPALLSDAMKAVAEMIARSENVAERFPEEARKIHYGETAPRSIRGQASMQETRELLEEGIGVIPLPFPAKEDTH